MTTAYRPGLVSVCCLSYNHAAFIEKCVRSIWAQEYRDIEIIAVDDGSKDNSAEVLFRLQEESPFAMQVIAQENTGIVGKNFNNALKAATGEFVLFIALDDELYPDAISSKIHEMMRDRRIAFIANSQITGIDSDNKTDAFAPPLKLDSMEFPTVDDLLALEFEHFGAFYIQGTLIRKDICDTVGGFDEDMTGDDIVLRTKIFLYVQDNPEFTFRIFHYPACRYRVHESNVHKNSYRQMKIVAEYLERYWPGKKPPTIFDKWFYHSLQYSGWKEIGGLFRINALTHSYWRKPMTWLNLARWPFWTPSYYLKFFLYRYLLQNRAKADKYAKRIAR